MPKGAAGLNDPDNGITFGPDGNLYIPGYNSSNVVRFDPRTGASSVAVARNAMGLTRPTGLDFTPNGDLLIVDGNTVLRRDPATGGSRGTLVASGSGGIDGGTYLAVIAFAATPPAPVPVVEYYHPTLDHYFISSLPADIAALDSGALQGWARTGNGFKAYAEPVAGANPVCRFYLPPGNGDLHFHSASPSECAEVRSKFPTFVFEAAMLAKGYIAEGYGPDAAIMCAPAQEALRKPPHHRFRRSLQQGRQAPRPASSAPPGKSAHRRAEPGGPGSRRIIGNASQQASLPWTAINS